LVKPARQSELLGALVNVWTAHSDEPSARLVTRHSIAEMASLPPEIAGRWKGTRVLVVEDNIVNQKVASLILQNFGCQVEIAANGREALQSIENSTFEMVFMDCEMPEMDGYEATAAIRMRPDKKRALPIIAVTAKATKGDRERCLEAGMDDYLTKPVRAGDFQGALERWATGQKSETDKNEAVKDEVETPGETPELILNGSSSNFSAALDAETVARLRELAAATDASLLTQIFESFLGDGENRIQQLRGALEKGDTEILRKTAHALKGASGNIGALRVAEISQQLQALGEAGSLEGAGELVDQLENEFEQVRSEIAVELGTV
jgi:CheY-like chemotaxis protein/HPt (histidine-containing phosphotransfer) domain-containing protein